MAGARAAVPFSSAAEVDIALPRVIAQLRRNMLIAYPTETTYGLGSRTDRGAVDRLASLKGRAEEKPFLILIDGQAMLDALALRVPPAAAQLSSRFWPGPLTLVLPGPVSPANPRLNGPEGQVAVRCTSHLGAQRIIRALGEPITSTSANRSGLPSATTAAEIVAQWTDDVARGDLLVLDGGVLASSQPSTVVDCSGRRPRVLRVGAISLGALRDAGLELEGNG
jgi:L-threonylcarbamoyladenylate synthase